MPEGDVVWRTAHELHAALAGRVLLGADLRFPALATTDLSGRQTLEVVPRGKHLLHRIEGGLTLHSHLRMDGSWHVHRAPTDGGDPLGSPRARRHTTRAVLWTEDLVAIGDSLGMLDLVETRHESRVVGHLGPDLLDRAFDRDLALDNLVRDPEVPVGQALLDQRNLAGIGTIYASEPLFEHRVSPWTPVGQLSRETLGDVVDTARLWMVRACRLGPRPGRGASVSAASRTSGSAASRTSGSGATGTSVAVPPDGWLPWRHRVFGREGRPCPRCGTTLRADPIGRPPRERQITHCPVCQRPPEP